MCNLMRSLWFRNTCRYGLIAMNSICFVAGLVLIGAGIYLYVYKSELLSYVYSMPLARPACIIIITVGSAVLIPSFCGLLGAVRENHILLIIASIFWFLLLYTVIMALITCLSVIAAIMAIVTRVPWNGFDFIRQKMRESLQKDYGYNLNTSDYNVFITAMWDLAQQNWYCCAAEDNSWGIYRQSQWYELQPGEKENDRAMVPLSCCVKDQYGAYINPKKCQTWQLGPPKLASGPAINEAIFYGGCYVYGSQLLSRVTSGIIAMGIIFAVLVGLATLFALGLTCHILRMDRSPRSSSAPTNVKMYTSSQPGKWNNSYA